jgi:hypothetical protein
VFVPGSSLWFVCPSFVYRYRSWFEGTIQSECLTLRQDPESRRGATRSRTTTSTATRPRPTPHTGTRRAARPRPRAATREPRPTGTGTASHGRTMCGQNSRSPAVSIPRVLAMVRVRQFIYLIICRVSGAWRARRSSIINVVEDRFVWLRGVNNTTCEVCVYKDKYICICVPYKWLLPPGASVHAPHPGPCSRHCVMLHATGCMSHHGTRP